MRGMMLVGGASLLGGGAYLGGAFDSGAYYPMAPAAVEARLAGLNFGPEATGKMRLVLRSSGPAVVRWDLVADGQRIADVRAKLAPEAPGTRVEVVFAFTKGDALMGLEEDPFLNKIARVAMEEKIDSTLDGRAFDETLLQAKLAAAVAADPQGFANMQKSLQENLAEDLRRADSEPFRGGYPGPEAGISGQPTTAIRPTASAKPQRPADVRDTHADGGWGKK